SAILLDLRLPDGTGWSVLDRLKHDPATRHIPVDIISVEEDERRGLLLGAIHYLKKPVAREDLIQVLDCTKAFVKRRTRNLLLVAQDPEQRQSITELIGDGEVQITAAANAEEAAAALADGLFECIVLDTEFCGRSGVELLQRIRPNPVQGCLPVVLYGKRRLTSQEAAEFKNVGRKIVIHTAASPEQLFDLTALLLHRPLSRLPASKREMLDKLHLNDPMLAGKKVLLVDDDIRNIFTLTTVLERYQMKVLSVDNGRDAIGFLKKTPDIDVVLMDIMMPGLDGYSTMAAIRQSDSPNSPPVLALTAKAMTGDREKCLEAGATDYLAKPVNTEQLLSLLRVWLYPSGALAL